MKNRFRLTVVLVISLFIIVLILFLIYTAYKNELAAVFGSGSNNAQTVILDAGHGGLDGGAVGIDGTVEKDINLQITQKLKAVLELYGYNVIMTRSDDGSIHDSDAQSTREQKVSDIHNREKIINEHPDALFVSIHQNHFSQEHVHGTQVFYSRNNTLSPALAQHIQDAIVSHLQPDNKRLIKKSGTEIYLLYHSKIPSVMVECGFMSNKNDMTDLKNQEYQRVLAFSIADGITNYLKTQG